MQFELQNLDWQFMAGALPAVLSMAQMANKLMTNKISQEINPCMVNS